MIEARPPRVAPINSAGTEGRERDGRRGSALLPGAAGPGRRRKSAGLPEKSSPERCHGGRAGFRRWAKGHDESHGLFFCT